MLKLDGKESLDPQMSDFEWFGEVFNFSMFSWLYHFFLISELNTCPILMFEYSFRSLGPPLQESEQKLPLGAYKAPKTCQNGDFWHVFAIFR